MIINSVLICDNCKITLTQERIKYLMWEAGLYSSTLENLVHYCPICQREADLNFKKYSEIENSDGYGM